MPVTFTEHGYDADDPNGPFYRRVPGVSTASTTADVDVDSPWVDPDYSTIPGDSELPSDEDELYRVWPGPAMVMPTNLLPDGSAPSHDVVENAYRIQHVRYARADDADFILGEYRRQQQHLRDCLSLPRARRERREGRMQVVDTPETLARIEQLHAAERRRRAGR